MGSTSVSGVEQRGPEICTTSKMSRDLVMNQPEKEQPANATPQESSPEQSLIKSRFPDVGLRFLVDPKTNQLTVLVMDRTNKSIIRSIPPEELSKLNEGDLVDLFS